MQNINLYFTNQPTEWIQHKMGNTSNQKRPNDSNQSPKQVYKIDARIWQNKNAVDVTNQSQYNNNTTNNELKQQTRENNNDLWNNIREKETMKYLRKQQSS